MDTTAVFSKKTDHWETPAYIFDPLHEICKFTLDPCADAKTRKCEKFYSPEDDGLVQSWKGETVFINPPYSNVYDWISKAYQEYRDNNVTSVLLLPNRSDMPWFQEHVFHSAIIGFYRKRIKFIPCDGSKVTGAPFPSILMVFSQNVSPDLITYLKTVGVVGSLNECNLMRREPEKIIGSYQVTPDSNKWRELIV